MAQARLEKIGTIYSRVSALLKNGAMKEENKPIWLNVYEAFPPKYEPRFDRPGLTTPVRQIFYEEDKIRAKFHKQYKFYSMVNMLDTSKVSRTEQFLFIYKQLQKQGIPETDLYDKAVQEFLDKVKSEKNEKEERADEHSSKLLRRQMNAKSISKRKEIDAEIEATSEQSEEDLKKYKPIRLSVEKLFDKEDDIKKSE